MFNVGIIGAGGFGTKRARACTASPKARLAGIADIDPGIAGKAADELDTVPYTVEELIQRRDIDVVVICTPNSQHFPQIKRSLEAGKHVLCEKPLARTLKEVEALVDLARRSEATLKIGSNHRFFQEIRKAKEMTDQGLIGDLLTFNGRIGHTGENLQGRWNVERELSGGGTLLDNGWHVIDLARWFMGDFTGITGATSRAFWKEADVEDSATVVLTTVDGRMANITSSWRTFSGYLHIELNGTEGFILVDARFPGRTEHPLLYGSRAKNEGVRSLPLGNEGLNSIEEELSYYLSDLEEGREPEPTAADGLEIMRIISQVYGQDRHG